MKQSLELNLSQGLTMTPQLQQAIKLLQLSGMELNQEVREALDSNMMLELDEDDVTELQTGTAEADETELNGEEYPEAVIHESIPEELPVDTVWEDIYDTTAYYSQADDPAENYLYEHPDDRERNLQQHLLAQLDLFTLSVTDKAIALALIDAINDDGYLAVSLDEIRATLSTDLDTDPAEIEAVLYLLQTLEPAGVGARDLAECLSLQLAQLAPSVPWLAEARTLVSRHIQVLAKHDYKQLMKHMKLNREELEQVILLVRSLHPRPGNQVQQANVDYVMPEVLVKKAGGTWKVELNTNALPRLRINSRYAGLIRRGNNSASNNLLKHHLQEARSFIKSLRSRSETLLRVATSIVERQRAFLEHGEEAMKPLILHDIAVNLGLHHSTVSRATTRKYIHTPKGVFELKYFFSRHLSTDQGGTCSATAIRALIKKYVQAEQPEKPLSDSNIVKLLSGQGIRVARRTIAKYRESLSIPPSSDRKRANMIKH